MGVAFDITLGCGRGWMSTAGCRRIRAGCSQRSHRKNKDARF